MPEDKRREILVSVDNKGRVVLPRDARRSGLYAVEVTKKNEIILRPRVAVDPSEVVSKSTLAVLDESVANLAEGNLGEPIDLDGFLGEAHRDLNEENAPTSKRKKS